MATFLFTLVCFLVVVAAMAVGVAVTGKKLSGSCGGVGGGACSCSPERRARCHDKAAEENEPAQHDHTHAMAEDGATPHVVGAGVAARRHADVPIEPSRLTRGR